MPGQQLKIAIEKLKGSGVRITPQRQAILSFLIETMTHPTADEIYKMLETKFPNMSVATIYNNLKVFKDLGLIKELTYGDASSRFDANLQTHYHAICDRCGKIEDFYTENLSNVEQVAAKITGFKVASHRMEVYGTCRSCQLNH
ncbi:Fur family transcriptional regulator [Aneurinibacillus sp. Ricciae_BoGa-3]|nr:Fur family transcriptional regulator [Aneurinibacillus sp. Ricciae_BoGa-3]WCK55359.1 Fur family transcriptional regulator [Aneurinibacillus sp. Ricciae_BoGa-3]